jgi:hypothetical protein
MCGTVKLLEEFRTEHDQVDLSSRGYSDRNFIDGVVVNPILGKSTDGHQYNNNQGRFSGKCRR